MNRWPIVYLPIEFGPREFDSKGLLAAILAARGYVVVIGQQWMLYENLKRLPPGTILIKSFNSIHHGAMRVARAAGHRVAALEEELLSHMDRKLVEICCVGGLFDLPDVIFTNSVFEYEAMSALSGGRVRIEVAGNGRVDILKPKYRAFFQRDIDAVRARFGDFVLVNTNFSVTNTIWNNLEHSLKIQVRAGYVKPDDPDSMAAWHEQLAFEQTNKAAIITAIQELSRRRPSQNIILRPHPGEALERWNGVFDGLPNVSVVREGAHVPWTLACRILLHTSCTTGFEARAAGQMALSLVPRPNFISDSFISNKVNPVFTDPVKMIDAAEAYLDRGEMPVAPQLGLAETEYYVWNIGEKSGVERLAELLVQDLPPPGARIPIPPLPPYERAPQLKNKFNMTAQQCADVFQRILRAADIKCPMNIGVLGDSLFAVMPSALR